MKTPALALFARLVLLGGLGCGAPMTVGEACDDAVRAMCTRVATCLGGTAGDVESCTSSGVFECCGRVGTCQREVRDAQAVGRCVDATRATACIAWSTWAQAPDTTPVPMPGVCRGVAQPK